TKKDSQGICFVGNVHLPDFLASRITSRPGPIIRVDGTVVGMHRGAAPFTIGQRHGLHLGGGIPYFVVDKDMERNTVYVAQGTDPAELYASALIAEDMHWISGIVPATSFSCLARIRYRQPLQEVLVSPQEDGTVRMDFSTAQRAVSPGQFVVCYGDDGECL